MSCAATAIYKMNGCQQPSWCVPRYAFQPCQRQLRDLSEEVSVSRFNAASHLSALKHPLVFDLGGIPQDWLRCLWGGRCRRPSPSCAISE